METDSSTGQRSGRRPALKHLAILDDAGTQHRVEMQSVLAGADEHTRFVYSLATRVMKSPRPLLGILVCCLIGPLAIVSTIWLSRVFSGTVFGSVMQSPWAMSVVFFLFFPTWIIGERIAMRNRLYRGGPEFSRVFLVNGICPVCVYPLQGSRQEEDGFVRCAECGSAWACDRVETTRLLGPKHAVQRRMADRIGFTQQARWSERQIRDARGTRHALLDKQYGKAIDLADHYEHHARLVEAREVLRARHPMRRALGYGFGVFFALMIVIFMLTSIIGNWPPASVMQAVRLIWPLCLLWSMVFMMSLLANRQGHSANKPVAVSEMLKRDLCPACGGNLRGLERAEDGTRECPRCVASWKFR